jgi:hypothetical protein
MSLIEAKPSNIFAIVLANCGPDPITVSGFFIVKPDSHFLDRRLVLPIRLLLALTWASIFYIFVWTFRLLRSNPKLATNHQLFILGACLSIVGSVFLTVFLWVWNIDHGKYHTLLVLAGVATAFSRIILYYLTIVGLQFPLELSGVPFFVTAVILSMIMVAENFGMADFDCRQTGEWNLGFGSRPYTQFLAISVFCAGVIVWVARSPPPEAENSGKRKVLLVGFAGAFGLFFAASVAVAFARIGASLEMVRNVEWIPFVIEPLFFAVVVAVNGWFWIDFNPQGWEALDGGEDGRQADTDSNL